MKEPARLGRVEDNVSPFINFNSWVFLHPTVIIIAIMLTLFFGGALLYAFSGHAAVESGVMRNFMTNGV